MAADAVGRSATPGVRPRAARLRTPLVRKLAGVAVVAAGVCASVAGLQRVPAFSLLPAVLGLSAFVIGKYVFCPLRWQALSVSEHSTAWFVRAFAEAELLGLCTPGHAGADLWRVRRLERTGRRRACAFGEVAADRLVGSVGIVAFALLSGTTLPRPLLVGAVGGLLAAVAAVAVLLRARPGLRERVPSLPGPRRLAAAVAYSLGYQASVLVMLVGVVAAVGASVDPLQLAGVFAASQLAGVVPGPQGASPKDGALAFGMVALGVPLEAALGAVSLKAALAWVPGLALGSTAFLVSRASVRRARTAVAALPHPALPAIPALPHPTLPSLPALAALPHPSLPAFAPLEGVVPDGVPALGAAAA
ncbi:lysylphosphatidylglycerol synthase domain-containing protein [Motilibacter peucedani]|nr:lysylphosphatidylglycerol synthase domain-containing protein [Motilibacter peucedani]